MPILRQTVAGALQFTGIIGGLFNFEEFSHLTRSTGITIGMVTYFEPRGGVPPTVDVDIFAQPFGFGPTDRIPIATALSSDSLINPLTGNAELRTCSIELPREPGKRGLFWNIVLVTTGKLETASAFVQYRITPGPETSPEDSLS